MNSTLFQADRLTAELSELNIPRWLENFKVVAADSRLLEAVSPTF